MPPSPEVPILSVLLMPVCTPADSISSRAPGTWMSAQHPKVRTSKTHLSILPQPALPDFSPSRYDHSPDCPGPRPRTHFLVLSLTPHTPSLGILNLMTSHHLDLCNCAQSQPTSLACIAAAIEWPCCLRLAPYSLFPIQQSQGCFKVIYQTMHIHYPKSSPGFPQC